MPSTRTLLALGLCACWPALVSGQTITVGPNVDVSRRSGNESETAIAIDRSNPNNIVTFSNWDAGTDMFRAYSSNAGATWTATTVSSNAFSDPWLGSDSFGNIYMSYLNANVGNTTIARSTNGGQTFTTLTNVGNTSFGTDHPEMGVGPGPVSGQQSVWISHTNFTSTSQSVQLFGATSTGPGNTSSFTTPQNLSGSSSGDFGSVAVGPGGRVATTFMNPAGGSGPATLPIYSNPTGAAGGFSLVNSSIVTQVGGFRSIPAQPMRSIDAQVDLKYDFSGGPRNGTLYMIYTQAANTTTNDTNVVIRRSTDNGTTWTNEVRINDDTGTNSQFFSRLAVDQTTGYLAAVWLDARNSADNTKVELWGSVSADGGSTWLPNFKISQGQWDGRDLPGNLIDANEMGDYISLDYYNGKFVTTWADASNSTGNNPDGTQALDIYYAQVTVTPVPEPALGLLAVAGLLTWRVLRRRAA